jgi:2-methylcitrate dehydratase PrpD
VRILAAGRGIEAAYLAMEGVTGPAHAFEYRMPFTDQELAQKFHAPAEPALEKSQRDRNIELALNFRKASLKELMAACTGTG